ncbi:MAG: DUF2189 domain-containing protein [Sulfuritalea sp.]|nr:DUF2189 domain-containing protein [Sulfuritalea sp.]
MPEVRQIGFDAPVKWLKLGWADLWRQPGASLFYGVAIAVTGAVILRATASLPFLFAAAITGFMLVAPILTAGVYELSRCYLANEPVSLVDSMLAWNRNPSGLIGCGFLSILAGTVWQVISAVIISVFYTGLPLGPLEMMVEVLIDPQHCLVFSIYMAAGGLLAALVFIFSVVSIPMLVDRPCGVRCALITSLNAVGENPRQLAFWALIIMFLTSFGLATALVGLIVIMPWLGHASFHAYKDLVE